MIYTTTQVAPAEMRATKLINQYLPPRATPSDAALAELVLLEEDDLVLEGLIETGPLVIPTEEAELSPVGWLKWLA
jgi:hypothetical protein